MNIREFKFYLWSWPFLGAFLSFVVALIFKTNNASMVIMLGIIGGYIALMTYILGIRYLKDQGDTAAKETDSSVEKE